MSTERKERSNREWEGGGEGRGGEGLRVKFVAHGSLVNDHGCQMKTTNSGDRYKKPEKVMC